MVSGFDSSAPGVQTLTVTYEGYIATYEVEVKVPTHTVTYIVVNGTWEDGTTAPKTEEVEGGKSPVQIPAGMIPANNYEGGAWSPNPNGATINDMASFTYTFTAKQNPTAPDPVSYSSAKGDGGVWAKGSRETLDFTFKRSVDDDKTFGLFAGIEVDGKAVGGENYTAEAGSAVVKLSPEYLETLAQGAHMLIAQFEDDSATAAFSIAAEEERPLIGGDYYPVTWDPNGGVLSASTYPFEATSETTLQPAYKGAVLEVLAAPTREGCTFLHWDCNGKKYQPGQEFTVGGA